MKAASVYCRVSTKNQKFEGTSLDTQLESCLKLAKEKGYQVDEHHIIQECYSGLTLDRPYLSKLKGWIDAGEIQAVVIHAGDRFMRDGYDLITLKRYCDKANVELCCVTEDLSNELVTYILGWASRQEAEHIKERTGRGRRERVKRGLLPGGCSSQLYGYDYHEGKRVINSETGQVVRDIFRWYLEGDTMASLTARLHSLGIKSPRGNEAWRRSAIFKMLTKRAYTGRSEYGGIELEQPALVSLEDFERIQLKLKRNKELSKRNGKYHYLLSGHIHCSLCGRRYIGQTSHGKNRSYVCPLGSHNVRVNPCEGKSVRADSIEEVVWLEVERALQNPDVILAGLESVNDQDYEPELIALKARLKYYKNERRRLFDAFRITVDEDTFKDCIKQIDIDEASANKRYAEIEGLIKTADQTPTTKDINKACDLIGKNIERLAFEDRRRILEALKVKVHTGSTVRIEGVLPIELPPSKKWAKAPGLV